MFTLDKAPIDTEQKILLRSQFLQACAPETVEIHSPILDLRLTEGHLNPVGLGNAVEFSKGPLGQSTVAFDRARDYISADNNGRSRYGGSEYGIVQSVEAARVAEKFSNLHGGQGAIIVPSGLSAINVALSTFLKGKATILVPDNCYGPTDRVLDDMEKTNKQLAAFRYDVHSSAQEIDNLLEQIRRDGRQVDLIYLEAPGSQTFEIPHIKEIIGVAHRNKIRTVMDNSWASHARFRPLHHGIDVVIQATTKYEGGYGDTPSGIVVTRSLKDYEAIAFQARVQGIGAVSPQTCNRLFHRVDSTGDRINKHCASALMIAQWLKEQNFVEKIYCPFLPDSPDYGRFKEYFDKGNGLFTIQFNKDIDREAVEEFMDRLLLFRTGESWAGHVSLVLPVHPNRVLTKLPEGEMVRFSAGLENPVDLVRDLEQASPALA